jgi:hypothetical protein
LNEKQAAGALCALYLRKYSGIEENTAGPANPYPAKPPHTAKTLYDIKIRIFPKTIDKKLTIG